MSDYVGSEGLGAFLGGYYSRTHNEAGMLGYVQTQTENHWAAKLGAVLISPAYKIIAGGNWSRLRFGGSSPHTYKTVHSDRDGVALYVFHSLLSFS